MAGEVCGQVPLQLQVELAQPVGLPQHGAQVAVPAGNGMDLERAPSGFMGFHVRKHTGKRARMNIILVGRRGNRPTRVDIPLKQAGWAAVMAVGSLVLGAITLGHWLGERSARSDPEGLAAIAALKASIQQQREQLAEQQKRHQQELDALARELGRMQARSLRMDELALQLARLAEFDLEILQQELAQSPGVGGLDDPAGQTLDVSRFAQFLHELDRTLSRQETTLELLQSQMLDDARDQRYRPRGRPVESGWLSSRYGRRVDPISGKEAHHGGLDFSGHMGSPVVAVADGVVVWSGPRYGYGQLVEIDHGNGYITRYAHNRRNLVQVGERVTRGQRIAEMGKSGRATGPHVHFEILFHNRRLNPRPFLG